MIAYLLYTVKVSICVIVFYAFYAMALRNCTFFVINRMYLLFGIFASFLIPILHFSIFETQTHSAINTAVNNLMLPHEADFFQPQTITNAIDSFHYENALSVIYFIGIAIMFFKLLFSIKKVIRLKRNAEIEHIGNIKIARMNTLVPFSFFNYIFLPTTESNSMIIAHERAHIAQYHWVDLVIVEIVSLLLWFNPFVVLYKHALRLQHEYLADNATLTQHNQIETYLGCMLRQVKIVSLGVLESHFYCKTIKKRIVMITKNKTSIKYLGIYFLALPLICCLLFAFTNKSSFPSLNESEKQTSSSELNIPSICPVDLAKVKRMSKFGARNNPITKKQDFHYAVDFGIAEGEKIISTANGIVTENGNDSTKGNYIVVKHNEMYSTLYAKLKNSNVKIGDQVNKGQIIGLSGNTGVSIGPHLHYMVFKNGKAVNPEEYF